jgi:hypothetical protein
MLANRLSDVHPLAVSPVLVVLALVAAWPWDAPPLRAGAGLLTLLFIVSDGVSLALLPRHSRSFGPITPPLLALAVVRAGLAFVLGLAWPAWPALGLVAGLQLALTTIQIYATWFEPFRIQVIHHELVSPELKGAPPLRVLHLGDIHFEGWTVRERQIVQTVRDLAPDLILLTGDYLNLSSVEDPDAHAGVRDLLAELSTLAPTYAITGSPPVDLPHLVPAIFDGLPITWLLDEVDEIRPDGQRIRLVGVRCTADRREDGERFHQLISHLPDNRFTILLYHSPDLMPDAVEEGIDLYLAGHTHGGQICLPFFGAIVTSSDFWKQYEAGRYEEGSTTLYVTRGLGVEGLGAPRARFLSPPEIILWQIRGPESI